MASKKVKLSCRNVWKVYGKNPDGFFNNRSGNISDPKKLSKDMHEKQHIVANANVSFDVHVGEIFVIMGLSGSGKSTIIRCLSRLVEPTAGEVLLDGEDLLRKTSNELIEIRRHKMGMVFQNFGLIPHLNVMENISFPFREERKYSKGDLLDFFNFYNNTSVTETPQYMAGCFFIKKSKRSMSFINEWLDIFNKRFDLVDDTVSKLENLNGFLEHRHDQSVFSLLCKKYNLKSFSAYECDWAYLNNERTWLHNRKSPFLAKRDLKYSILKRFYNRQKKTFLRKKKGFVNLWQRTFKVKI